MESTSVNLLSSGLQKERKTVFEEEPRETEKKRGREREREREVYGSVCGSMCVCVYVGVWERKEAYM